MTASSITAIDSHAHVFRHDLPFAAESRHAPTYNAPLDDYLRLLDAHSVSHGVLVQPSFLGTDNSFLIAALDAQPNRLRGVAVVAPDTEEDELHSLGRHGVCGVRLNLVGARLPDLRGGLWPRFLSFVRALDWHVEVHRELDDLAVVGQPILDAGCKLVVDHFGRPRASNAGLAWLLGAAESERAWVKLSASYRNWPLSDTRAAIAAAGQLLHAFGPGRLVWGSDWPHTQHRDVAGFSASLAALDEWVPDPAARHAILVDTPRQLFRFSQGDNNA